MNVITKTGQWLSFVTIMTMVTTLPFVAGCASSSRATIGNPVEIDVTEYDRIFRASVDVLQNKGFGIDRQDYRFGVVTSRPRSSPTAFEPWHRDNTTLAQTLESTTNYQRRRVAIRLIPADSLAPAKQAESDSPSLARPDADATQADAGYLLEVQVVVEQVEAPTRQLTGATGHRRMFRDLAAPPDNLARRQITENYWRPVGRDKNLEQQLVADILRQSLDYVRSPAAY